MPEDRTGGRVCVLYTGGTIGLRSLRPDLEPEQPAMLRLHEVESRLRQLSDLHLDYSFVPLPGPGGAPFEPLESSRILPRHWTVIAETIQHHYDDYDGFVVLHGTDTLAWTASALSFMFTNLSKPIVLTGAQRPISPAPSDAVSNFVNSVVLAGRGDESIPLIPEVVVCFGDLVLRGNRTTKISAASMQGFDTPNVPHLGRVGRRFEINYEQVRPEPARADGCFARLELEPAVVDVVLYPGMSPRHLARALEDCAGAVLRTFGAGNAPGDDELRRVLRSAVDKGTVLVNVTQSNEGTVESGMLTGARDLTDCGVVSGLDLTPEAAFTKLMVLLGSGPPGTVAEQMQFDQRGEQSLDLVVLRGEQCEPGTDRASRVVLTDALHARARADRLTSAVLIVRERRSSRSGPPVSPVTLHLNHWEAGRHTRDDRRALGTHSFRRGETVETTEMVIDVTEVARDVLVVGAPVSLTVVPVDGIGDVEVVLYLFMQRTVADTT